MLIVGMIGGGEEGVELGTEHILEVMIMCILVQVVWSGRASVKHTAGVERVWISLWLV